jgi:hypothetical protein
MRTTRAITISVTLALASTGCGENATNPSGAALSFANAGNRGSGAEGLREGCDGLPVADDSLRVDLYTPAFSNPTDVTNPLFPIGELDRVLLLGQVDGLPFRTETTLMPETRVIELDGGQRVEALVSQYVAFLDGRIHEVALDWYVQDDAGAVWYLGEDVFNYEEGVVADTDGTWLAGRDGPAAMIMPADPQVGNVWRPENICGFVFEEVTALETGVTVDGPRGPIIGALITRELHMDATTEDKTFAPGYGEFSTGSPGGDLEAVALAVPIDALPGPAPDEVETLSDGAEAIFELARSGRWQSIAAEAGAMNGAWDAFQATGVPPMLDAQMSDALETLDEAIARRDKSDVRQATIGVALASLDFELRHEERSEIDLDLIEVWLRQLVIDAQARDRAGVRGDLATIRWIRDRLGSEAGRPIDRFLGDPAAAEGAADVDSLAETAENLRQELSAGRRSAR